MSLLIRGYLTYHAVPSFFKFDYFLDSRTEIQQIFALVFWKVILKLTGLYILLTKDFYLLPKVYIYLLLLPVIEFKAIHHEKFSAISLREIHLELVLNKAFKRDTR